MSIDRITILCKRSGRKRSRLALGGISCTKYRPGLMFGREVVRNDSWNAPSGSNFEAFWHKPEFWDIHPVMIPDIQFNAVFGASLFKYGTGSGARVGLKLLYGDFMGTG
eukprot:87657_1